MILIQQIIPNPTRASQVARRLGLGLGDGAEHTGLGGNVVDLVILLLHGRLVGGLEALDGLLEAILGGLHLSVERLDLGIEGGLVEACGGRGGNPSALAQRAPPFKHHPSWTSRGTAEERHGGTRRGWGAGLTRLLVNELDLLLGAHLLVVGGALGAEVVVHVLHEVVELAAALVVIALGVAREGLEGGVAADAELLAEVLGVIGGAVNIADDNGRGVLVLVAELVPVRLESLAVAAPGGKELHEGRLAAVEHERVEVLPVEVDGGGGGRGREGESSDDVLGHG
mmetsp:Transcript_8784/g.28994  ORF Transcript_8784/g.28994 Transcript_8784/m.28994 type:complete len:284 (+) Transcript_8784:934-1785(+)